MNKFKFLIKEIWKGKSVIRSYLNYHLLTVELKGKTIDIGGGSGEGYVSFVKRAPDVTFETFDLKVGKSIDFEKDVLPAETSSYDTVLFLNVMEHIYNHQHIANEVVRIVKPGGQLIGYVPFLMWYHPDHRDFFRYTHEAIEKIFETAGAKEVNITPNYVGPFMAASQMYLLSIPKLLRPLFFSFAYLLDGVFFTVKRERISSRFVLGYLFTVQKKCTNL